MSPDAAVADFETAHPGWRVHWREAGKWYARRARAMHPSPFEHPAAYVATHGGRNVSACGATLEELETAMEEAPAQRHWMWKDNCCELSWG